LRSLIAQNDDHRALYEVFLKVRDSAAKILESTTIADLVSGSHGTRKRGKKKKEALSIVERGTKSS
jgi:DNA-binding IscR family transcriptional regulator